MFVILTIGLVAAVFLYYLEGQARAADHPCPPLMVEYHSVPPPPMPLGMMLLSDAMAENAVLELSQKPSAPSKGTAVLVLPDRGIDPDHFHKAVDERSVKLVGLAVTANLISREQGNDILEEMKERTAQRESAKEEREIATWMDDENELDWAFSCDMFNR